ncbi:hypothetical protein [Gordonia alkanivorans]|uniref:hypothetical protein n=1 Tax=Gordonia alkanivorans TaxID=84096 RepID=UPI00244D141C|nr:hypothetical protein [Gordonia alkanivorans]MDH3013904.1 hypothetical protein [Gordonia alkanivorans]
MSGGDGLLESMGYQPASPVDSMVAATPREIAQRAADIVATVPDSRDAVSEAADCLPGYIEAGVVWDLVAVVEWMADRIARSRRPLLGEMLGTGPVPWECWQRELIEPWPILADAATKLGKSLPARRPTADSMAVVPVRPQLGDPGQR